MEIVITTGTGIGKTTLSAFDAALHDAGVCNYNLLVLSSVIPPNVQIVRRKYVTPESEFGHRLYVVRAEMRSEKQGEWIGGGVGWYQREDGSGLFVEHEEVAHSKEELESMLKKKITDSLSDLCATRGYPFGEEKIDMQFSVTQVQDKPACAMVLAVYQSQGW